MGSQAIVRLQCLQRHSVIDFLCTPSLQLAPETASNAMRKNIHAFPHSHILATDIVVKEFLKKLSDYRIERYKRLAEIRLNDLQLLK